MATSTEPLLIVGTGALASLFAARFARAGLPVTMLGSWPKGVKAIQGQGLHLIETDGSETRVPVRVVDSPEECPGTTHALVLVKSWQTERTAQQLARCISPEGQVLTLQNGLGNQDILERWLTACRVSTGITTTGATLLGPGRVRAGGEGKISLPKDPHLHTFVHGFRQAGFLVETVSDLEGLVWGKLMVNAAINPLTALLGVPNGDLLHLHTARVLMEKIVGEVAAVAKVKGVALPFEHPVAAVEEVARKTATNRSSMLQDIQRGAPTEIEAICGAVVSIGEELGVPVPVNETLVHLVKALVEVKNIG